MYHRAICDSITRPMWFDTDHNLIYEHIKLWTRRILQHYRKNSECRVYSRKQTEWMFN